MLLQFVLLPQSAFCANAPCVPAANTLCSRLSRAIPLPLLPPLQADVVNEMPLYPTETVLFDENQVPTVHYTGESGGSVHWAGWEWVPEWVPGTVAGHAAVQQALLHAG